MSLTDLSDEAREALHIICEYGVGQCGVNGGRNYAPPLHGIVPTVDYHGSHELAKRGLVGTIGRSLTGDGNATLYALTPAGREALGIEVRDFVAAEAAVAADDPFGWPTPDGGF